MHICEGCCADALFPRPDLGIPSRQALFNICGDNSDALNS